MKKNLFLGIAAVSLLFTLVFAGCSQSANNSSPNNPKGDTANPAPGTIALPDFIESITVENDARNVFTFVFKEPVSMAAQHRGLGSHLSFRFYQGE